MSIPGRIPWRWATVALLLALLAVTSLASAASAGAVRECVQRNLPRYTNPGSAVVAQYADVETTCRAALDDGSVSVEFDPGGDASSGTGGQGSGGAATGGGTAEPATPAPRDASPAPAAPTPKPAPARPRPRASGGTTTQPAADDSGKIVAQAIAQAGTGGAGSPLPSSLSEGSAWRYILVGGAVLLVVVAGGLAVRRRLN